MFLKHNFNETHFRKDEEKKVRKDPFEKSQILNNFDIINFALTNISKEKEKSAQNFEKIRKDYKKMTDIHKIEYFFLKKV